MGGFNLRSLKEMGGVFKFGRGLLGKSAIPVFALMVAVVVAVWRLRSDYAILGAVVMGAVVFFCWFFPILRFSEAHPDVALLEGAEWSGYKRFETESQGLALGIGNESEVRPQRDLEGMQRPDIITQEGGGGT